MDEIQKQISMLKSKHYVEDFIDRLPNLAFLKHRGVVYRADEDFWCDFWDEFWQVFPCNSQYSLQDELFADYEAAKKKKFDLFEVLRPFLKEYEAPGGYTLYIGDSEWLAHNLVDIMRFLCEEQPK